jgi:hypothetical protein
VELSDPSVELSNPPEAHSPIPANVAALKASDKP